MSSTSRAPRRTVNPAQLISMFLAFLMVAGVGGVLTAGLLMPAVTTVGATATAGAQLFDDLPTALDEQALSERSTIRYRDGSVMANFYVDDRIIVPLDQVSEYMGDAVVAVEDRRFYEHGGVDPEGLFRALVQNLSGSALQGGSTLTQQYVKNVLIQAGVRANDPEAIEAARETSIGRKLREAKLAIALERVRSKDQILEGYLNIAQFGPSQYGVEAAARYYFSKSAADLTISEAAMLAGITQAPNRYNPVPEENRQAARDRRDTVLALMRNQGYITDDEYNEAIAVRVVDMLNVSNVPPSCATADETHSGFFCEYVVRTILNSPEYGETQADRYDRLTRGGLDITTTIDPRLQREAFAALTNAVPVDDASGVSNAISTVQPGTGQILAMAQNTPFGDPNDGGPPRTTEVNFNADAAFGGSQGFQTGSTFKAVILAAWLEAGNSLNDVVNGAPGQSFPNDRWDYSGCTSFAPQPGNPYEPRNIEGVGTGRLSVAQATEQSVNTAFVDMASQLNMCDVTDLALRLGLHVGTGVDPRSELPLFPSPSMVLGANNIAPLTMAAAFATFASGGTYCAPIAILEMKDAGGADLPVPEAGCQRAIDAEVANTVTHALRGVVEGTNRATGNAARLDGRPVAGKTGTANEDTAAWFIGYVPQMSTAVWNGFSEALTPMMNITINGTFYRYVFGGGFAAPIWQDYMSQALQGSEVQQFPGPADDLVFGERTFVPSVAGLSVDDATRRLEGAGFGVRVGDARESDSVPEGAVAASQPGGGSLVQRGSQVTLIPSSGPPDNGGGDDGGGDGGDNGGDGGGGDNGGGGGGGDGGGGDD